MTKYKTFGRRFWAAIVDMAVFVPLGWLDNTIWVNAKVPIVLSVWLVINTSIFWLYEVLLLGYYGQTIGKFVCNVKVLDKTEKPLSMRQAFYREAVPIIIGIPVLFYEINNVLAGHIANKGLPTEMNFIWKAFLGFSLLWFLLELVTMLTNKKRRAVHDFIAGSVVVRLESNGTPEEKKKARYRKLLFFSLMVLLVFDMIWTISKKHLTR
jgi:uncharacterized RDD family membrane protein YckC